MNGDVPCVHSDWGLWYWLPGRAVYPATSVDADECRRRRARKDVPLAGDVHGPLESEGHLRWHSPRSGRAQRNRPRPDRCGSRLRGWARPLAATSRSAVPPVGLERTQLLPYRDRSQHRLESSPGGPGMPGDPRRTGSVPPVIADAGPVDRCAARPEQRVDPARGSPAARAGEAPAGPSASAARACRTSRPQGRRAGSIVAARPLRSGFPRPPAPPHTRTPGCSIGNLSKF